MDVLQWLEQGWVIVAAIIGGVTLFWNFTHKTLKEITDEVTKPLKDITNKINELKSKMDDTEKHNGVVNRALLTLQRNSLLKSCEDYMSKGFATMEEKSTISDQYTSYSELGGDTFVTDMVANVMNLPLEKSSKKQKVKEVN